MNYLGGFETIYHKYPGTQTFVIARSAPVADGVEGISKLRLATEKRLFRQLGPTPARLWSG
ncbi:MAG: hypothetical protein ACR2GB_02745 [Nocardioidaceae bacterium]